MGSKLIIVPVAQLQSEVVGTVKAVGGSVIYVSLNKSFENMEKLFDEEGVKKKVFFIDCVSSKVVSENVLYVLPRELDKLVYGIKAFGNEIEGKKVVVIDGLSTLLIYNSENRVAAFVRDAVGLSTKNGIDVVAFVPKTEEEELFRKIFNFFDEVEKR
jgi:hypothetical protein